MAPMALRLAAVLIPPLGLAAAITFIVWQRLVIDDLHTANAFLTATNLQLADQLNHDDLTGLLNRGGFRRNLTAHLHGSTHLAVALIDVNDFKAINDTHSHAAGDLALQHVATQLETIGQRDAISVTAARLSGDEFALLVHDDVPAIQHLAGEIARSLRLSPLMYNGVKIQVHLSIGIATHRPTDGPLTAEDILTRADHAMYHAKRRPAGLPHIATWTPGLRMPTPIDSGDRRTFRHSAREPVNDHPI